MLKTGCLETSQLSKTNVHLLICTELSEKDEFKMLFSRMKIENSVYLVVICNDFIFQNENLMK